MKFKVYRVWKSAVLPSLNLPNPLNQVVFLFRKDAIIADLFLSDLGAFSGLLTYFDGRI